VASNTRRDFDGLAAAGGWPLVLDKCGDELAAPWLGLFALPVRGGAPLLSPPSTHTYAISCPCMTSAGVSPRALLMILIPCTAHNTLACTASTYPLRLLPPPPAIGDFSSRAMQMPRLALSKRYILLPFLTYFHTAAITFGYSHAYLTCRPPFLLSPPVDVH
jgi:hypothetical protein